MMTQSTGVQFGQKRVYPTREGWEVFKSLRATDSSLEGVEVLRGGKRRTKSGQQYRPLTIIIDFPGEPDREASVLAKLLRNIPEGMRRPGPNANDPRAYPQY
ncbi:MAG: hypothetical protein AB7P76_06325 [Candidatus Melainabacteria bacterium]